MYKKVELFLVFVGLAFGAVAQESDTAKVEGPAEVPVISYAELYFTDVFWPDFREEELYGAILYYQRRERRFGKTSEQLIL